MLNSYDKIEIYNFSVKYLWKILRDLGIKIIHIYTNKALLRKVVQNAYMEISAMKNVSW